VADAATGSYLCSTLGMRHVSTTAYHQQSNGLVKRFHRQLKEALKARASGPAWLEHLPFVLLGLKAAPKEEANVSAALGESPVLPGQLTPPQPPLRAEERPNIPSTVQSYADVASSPPLLFKASSSSTCRESLQLGL